MLFRIVLAVVVATITPVVSRAVVTVTSDPPPSQGQPNWTITEVSTGLYDVTLNTNISSQPTTFTISGATTDALRNVAINATASSQITIVNIQGPSSAQTLASVAAIDMGSSTSTVILSRLLTTGNVGEIEVNIIGVTDLTDIDIGGNVTGTVNLLQRSSGDSHLVQMRVRGNLLGDVFVDYGGIIDLLVDGDIGTSGSLRTIRAADYIDHIDADSIYANISATVATANVRRIKTTVGPFFGSLTALGLYSNVTTEGDGVRIAGSLDANLTFGDPLVPGSGAIQEPITAASLAAGRTIFARGSLYDDGLPNGDANGRITIGSAGVGNMAGTIKTGTVVRGPITIAGMLSGTVRIGTSLHSGGSITCGSTGTAGLSGQIIINASNGTGTWAGSVRVNGSSSTPLSGSGYTNTATSIGGGAAGVARFDFHGESCSPVENAFVSLPPNLTTVTVRHYGPIGYSGTPVSVKRRLLGSTGSFSTYTSTFTFSQPAPQSLRIVANSPSIFAGGYEYEITPVGGLLWCADVDGTPNVLLYSYRFSVQAQPDGPGGGD